MSTSESTPAAEPSAAPSAAPEAPEPAAAEAATETPAPTDAAPPAEAAASEAPPPATEKPAEPDPHERNWAAIRKQAKELRAEKEEIKAVRKDAETYRQMREVAAKDPLKFLELSGLSFETVADAVLKQGEPPAEEDRVAKLERKLQEREEADQKAQAQALERQRHTVITQFESSLVEQIKAAGEKYELINAKGAHDEVIAAVREYAVEHGELPDIAAVIEATEAALEEEAIKAAQTKKIQSRLAPKAPPSNPSASAERAAGTTTLTNRAVSSAPAQLDADDLPLDPDERTRAIVARLFAEGA